jgi:hypothetical protein
MTARRTACDKLFVRYIERFGTTAPRRHFQLVGVSFTDVSATSPIGAIAPPGLRMSWQCRRRGRKYTAQGSTARPEIESKLMGTGVSTRDNQWRPTCRDYLQPKGDEKMRASKLITISTAAVLMGGTGLAVGHSWQSGQSQNQNNASAQAPAAMSQANAQAAEQDSKLKGSRQYQRSQAMTTQHDQASSTQRGRAVTAARGQAMIERGERIAGPRGQGGSERGRAAAAYEPQPAVHARQSLRQPDRPAYAQATASEVRGSLTPEQRAHLREMARRELPRVSHIPEVRVNAIVPRDVTLAPVPGEIARYYPRFRHNQAVAETSLQGSTSLFVDWPG